MAGRVAALFFSCALACASGGDALPPGFQDAAYAARDDDREHRRYRMQLARRHHAPVMDVVRACRLA